jgi:hypothetical protein
MKTAKWIFKRTNSQTVHAELRGGLKGRGQYFGGHSWWQNSRAEEEADKIATAIEEKAKSKGYSIQVELE